MLARGRLVIQGLLGFSFAIHHAGLPKADRAVVEDLYLAKQIQVTLEGHPSMKGHSLCKCSDKKPL